jgi:hypothetical protein
LGHPRFSVNIHVTSSSYFLLTFDIRDAVVIIAEVLYFPMAMQQRICIHIK